MTNKIEVIKLSDNTIIVYDSPTLWLSGVYPLVDFINIKIKDDRGNKGFAIDLSQAKELAEILPEFIKKIEEEK